MRASAIIGALLGAILGTAPAHAEDSTTLLLVAETGTATAPGQNLAELIQEACDHAFQVRIERAKIKEAEALYGYAASLAYPRFSFNALVGGPTPEARTTVVNDLSTITPSSLETDFDFGSPGFTMRGQVEGALPLYTFGKIDSGKEAAAHLVKAAEHAVTVSQAEVAVNVVKAFWTFQLTRTYLGSLSEGRETLEKVLKRIEDLLDHDSPQVTENDRLRLKFALATLAVRETEAKNINLVAQQAMRILLGREQTAPLEIRLADLEDLPTEIPPVDRLVRLARSGRPEVLALGEVVEAAQAFVHLRKVLFLPDFFLGGFLRGAYTSNATNQTNPFINDPFNNFDLGVGLGIRGELDIFTKLAQLEQAEAEAEVRAAQAEAVVAASDFEVRRLHVDLVGGYERIGSLEKANTTARGWLAASVLAYDLGTGRADELIDAFLAWAASEAELQKTRYDTLLTFSAVAQATGRMVGANAGSFAE